MPLPARKLNIKSIIRAFVKGTYIYSMSVKEIGDSVSLKALMKHRHKWTDREYDEYDKQYSQWMKRY